MNCSYCGRRMPGRLYMTGVRTCQGCGAQLPEPPKEYDEAGVIEKSVTWTYYEQERHKPDPLAFFAGYPIYDREVCKRLIKIYGEDTDMFYVVGSKKDKHETL